MTVQQLTEQLSLTVFHLDDPDRAVTGGYCGDLLSWVMGRAPADGAWLTIMSNVNVARPWPPLTRRGRVVLTESVQPDPPLLQKAPDAGHQPAGYGAVYLRLRRGSGGSAGPPPLGRGCPWLPLGGGAVRQQEG